MLPHPTTVTAVLRGTQSSVGPKHEPTGIHKTPLAGVADITATGLGGDFQGDLKHHGGPDKALHHYPLEHYAFWENLCGPLPAKPGAFGENISTLGLTEHTVHLGDTFRLGTALVQVSQGRQPCWKLNFRLGHPDVSLIMQEKGFTGWYYRVLEPGRVQAGDAVSLVERPLPLWPLARLLEMIHSRCLAPEELRQAAALPLLAENWQRLFGRRLETGRVEDWDNRLYGHCKPESLPL